MNFQFGFPTIPTFDSLSIPMSPVAAGGGSTFDYNSTIPYNKVVLTGSSNDYIRAGLGNDSVTGGAGADTFAFNSLAEGIDTITDFSIAQGDRIQVSAAGFGIGAADLARFNYNPVNGILALNTTPLAVLPQNLAFSVPANITISL